MGAGISYMGTKREIAGDVAEIIGICRDGPLLDVFSGMCSVGQAVGTSRQVWTNDVQVFASEVGTALFTSSTRPLGSQSVADRFHKRFSAHFDHLANHFETALSIEAELLDAVDFDSFQRLRSALQKALSQQNILAGEQHQLFSHLYADSYFGVRQALELDSIVHAIGWPDSAGVSDAKRWYIIALGRAALRVSNSTGHFAQFLTPKPSNYKTFQRQRRRRIWEEWLNSNDELSPVGDDNWRKSNRSFNSDALSLLQWLASTNCLPSVVYADPPYTNDQYSRYYHLFETLYLYDYPDVSGAGRYRSNRFSTTFSLKSQAATAIESLVKAVHSIGADIVLSYPSNGLAYSSNFSPHCLLRGIYGNVDTSRGLVHSHSTLGASKGPATELVTENIYMARA